MSPLAPTPVEGRLPASREILAALQARLESLRWNEEPAFGLVAMYDVRDLSLALEELQTSASRLCLVLYEGDRFENLRPGRQLHVRRSLHVTLLMADLHLASRPRAVFGDARTAGAVTLKDIVLGLPASDGAPTGGPSPSILGPLFSNALVLPIAAMAMPGTDPAAGRGAWMLQLEIIGGQLTLELGQQPFL